MVSHWYLSALVIFLVYLIQRASDKDRLFTTPLSLAIAYSASTSHPPYPWKDIEALVCVPDVLCFTISSSCGRERSKHFRRGRPRLPFLIISTLIPRTILFTVLPLAHNEGEGSYSSPMIRPSNQPLPNTSMTHVLRYGIERHRP
jgi:hypothetical protein